MARVEKRWLVEVKDSSGSHTNSVYAYDAVQAAEEAAAWSGVSIDAVLRVERV